MSRGPFAVDDARTVAQLRQALAAAGYTPEGVRAALDVEGEGSPGLADVAAHLRQLADGEALSTLIKLFLLGASVPAAEAEQALAPAPLRRLERLGLVRSNAAGVEPLVRLVPFGDLVLACDRGDDQTPAEQGRDHVAGVHAPSITLAKLAVRRPIESMLDLGTGLGIQALLGARHAAQVTATDVNPRALAFARFNARLNGVTNVEFREGSYFEPVAGLEFDLVLANPPYVISPDSQYAYRDGGLPGDAVSRGVVGAAPACLREGGFAELLVSWVVRRDEEWSAPLERWVDGSGCDAWLLHYKTEDPLAHSAGWLRPLQGDPAAHAQALDRWLDYLRGLGIEAIAYGAVILRRRSGARNWVRTAELPAGRLQQAGSHVERVFAGVDYLDGLADRRDLLAAKPIVAERLRLEQTLVRDGRSWKVQAAVLSLEEGLGFRGEVDPLTAELLAQLDGEQPLREAIAAAGRALGWDDAGDEFVSGGLAVIERLLGLGLLELREPG